MSSLPAPWSDYRDADAFDATWCELAAAGGARASVAGYSVEGRPIRRFDFGAQEGPTLLLTGLIHGIELIGSVALLDFVRAMTSSASAGGSGSMLRHARMVVMPVVNPDALHANTSRLMQGKRAYQRGNARGVDLNRNFPQLSRERPLNPMSGSRFRFSPWYVGPHPFSEPETRAVRDVACEVRPHVSLGFHSFGDMLLYPWAFTFQANPRKSRYERLGGAFRKSLRHTPYSVGQATQLYRTVGDMDDWLDAELGTLAFTVEVSRPMAKLAKLAKVRRLLHPFAWSNPERVEPALSNLTPGLDALVRDALAA